MASINLIKKPILTLSEWKNILFPEMTEEDSENDTSPSDIAAKWATLAVKSLPKKPTKPVQ